MNTINRYFNDDIYLQTTSNFFDFSRADKPMPRPNLQPLMADYVPEARENVGRKRNFSSSQQDEYNIDNSKDEKWKEDAEMIRTRWDVKSLADPNVNLTVSNYRKRVFGDNRPPPRREFKRDALFEKSSLLTENNEKDDRKEVEDELLKKDQKSLNERIEIINVKYDQAKFKLESDFQNRTNNEARFNCFAYQVQYDYNFNEYYNDFQSELNQIEESRQSEIDSFKELFKSGEYKKGTLHEYTTLEIYQPSAKRRKYDDDGFRRTILPQRLIDSIRVENELYQRFYNKPH